MTDHNTSAESVEDVLFAMRADARISTGLAKMVLEGYAHRVQQAYNRERANSSASIPVTVELSADGDTFIARAAGIHYVASGDCGDEAKRNFARGLMATLAAHVERMREPSKLLDAANSSESPKGSFSIAGTITQAGNDEDGKPRIVVHTTREEIMAVPINMLGQRVLVDQRVSVTVNAANYPAKSDGSFSGQGDAEALLRRELGDAYAHGLLGAPFTVADCARQIARRLTSTQPAAVKDSLTTQQAADSARLDELERLANSGGVLLHDGSDFNAAARTAVGIGLRPGMLVRTLREAIDAAMPGGEQSNG